MQEKEPMTVKQIVEYPQMNAYTPSKHRLPSKSSSIKIDDQQHFKKNTSDKRIIRKSPV